MQTTHDLAGVTPASEADDRLVTPRLILRPPAYSDAAGLHALLSNADVCRYSPAGLVRDIGQVRWLIAHWHEARETGLRMFTIAGVASPRDVVGLVQVGPDEELGGMISPAAGGRGFAREAIEAVASHMALRRLWCILDADHVALARTLAGVNILPDRRLPAYRVHPLIGPEKRDCILYRQQPRDRTDRPQGLS